MSQAIEEQAWQALKTVKFPGMSRDIVSFGFVRAVRVEAGQVHVDIDMATQNDAAGDDVRAQAERALAAIPGVRQVAVQIHVSKPPSRDEATQKSIARDGGLVPEVRHIVAVASGKGGVGKSTVAANLAVRLGQLGHRVGLLDADIYGPSVPMMFGINEHPRVVGNKLVPFERYGIRLMSLGFVLDIDQPVIWRGPMVMRAIEQMLADCEWGALDFLIVDLPPGTGDAQLTITQKVPLSGAVIVTTPQDVALIDARKGLAMFRKVNVPVVGIIENMSGFVCPHCGETTDVFKRGGGERTAEVLDCAFLGRIPLDPAIMSGGDSGQPIVVSAPGGPHAEAFTRVARAVVAEVEAQGAAVPKLSIS
jgi:ATP-binding protein involved in chromosome partitioning